MRGNPELLNGEPMDDVDVLRAEISHLGQKFDEEFSAPRGMLAALLHELLLPWRDFPKILAFYAIMAVVGATFLVALKVFAGY